MITRTLVACRSNRIDKIFTICLLVLATPISLASEADDDKYKVPPCIEACTECKQVSIAAAQTYHPLIDVFNTVSCEARTRLSDAQKRLGGLLEPSTQPALLDAFMEESPGVRKKYVNAIKNFKADKPIDEELFEASSSFTAKQDSEEVLKAWIDEFNDAYADQIRGLEFRAIKTKGSEAALTALRAGIALTEPPAGARPVREPERCNTKDLTEDNGANKPVRFAIAQNDAAFSRLQGNDEDKKLQIDACESFSELSKVLALFHGYIQLLTQEDPLELGKQIQARKVLRPISIGSSGATQRHARTILAEWGLREHVNYDPAMESSKVAEAMTKDELAGYFKSSFLSHEAKHKLLPTSVINALLERAPYYSREAVPKWFCKKYKDSVKHGLCEPDPEDPPKGLRPTPNTFLSITTSLFTRDDVDEALVGDVTRALLRNWTRITELAAKLEPTKIDLVPINAELLLPPPYHDAALEAIEDSELLGDDWLVRVAAWVSLVFLIFALIWVAFGRYAVIYDRMGMTGSLRQRIPFAIRSMVNWVSAIRLNRELGRQVWQASAPFFAITATVLVVYTVLLALAINWLKSLESAHAQIQNTVDPLVGKTLWESLIWIFTFLVSGYEDQIFPSSSEGKILISVLALLTLFVPIFTVTRVINLVTQNQRMRRRGDSSFMRLQGHLVVCGWNAKAPGIIYSLTGRDAPVRNQVVIVAEMPSEEPLVQYNFSPSLVHFVRGDSANVVALHRASIEHASHVVILAGDMKRGERNVGSALTALAISEINDHASISVELAYRENKRYFERVPITHVVDAEQISERMIAVACDTPRSVDFILDVLSLDEFSEWYGLTGETIAEKFDKASTQDLVRIAAASKLNLIGIVRSPESEKSEQISIMFGDEHNKRIGNEDIAIFAAEDARRLKRIKNSQPWEAESFTSDLVLLKPPKKEQRVLVIGESTRAERLQALLEDELVKPEVELIKTDDDELKSEVLIHQAIETKLAAKWDHIVLMSAVMGDEALELQQAHRSDAATVLRADLIDDKAPGVHMVAELTDFNSRHLLEKAGVHTVVPGGLLAERLLVQRALGTGVPRMVTAMIDGQDGFRLRQVKLEKKHPLIDTLFSVALTTQYTDGRVIAALSTSSKRRTENELRDFATHFLMCPSEDFKFSVGDELLIVTRS